MATPQPGIFSQGTLAHRHLEFDLRPGTAPDAVREALAPLRQPSVTAGGANIVVGFGAECWARVVPDHVGPPYPRIEGLVATPHDVWVWVHGTGDDVLLDVSRHIAALLDPVAQLVDEVAGFVYHDSRDLTGFVDGTENPPLEEAYHVAVRADGEPGAGGSFALVQRWVHDLASFHALDVTAQEAVIGRTKPDSVELDDEHKPATAHIARVVIEEHGEELEIYRRSVPYGNVREHGLQFVAFSADPTRFDRMLARMFGTSGDGLRDRLTEFSRPVSGAYYFVPALDALGDALG